MNRCDWVPGGDSLYEAYHDNEWGVPVRSDQKLFEMLILEGAQAGLSWRTILAKRDGYRRLFYDFDAPSCAEMTDSYIQEALKDPAIVRNRLKVLSIRRNARIFLGIQQEFGSFTNYLWGFVDGRSVKNHPKTNSEVPASTDLSDKISKDLKKRGMSFVGSTIIYAYMQAVGLVDDHTIKCFKY